MHIYTKTIYYQPISVYDGSCSFLFVIISVWWVYDNFTTSSIREKNRK